MMKAAATALLLLAHLAVPAPAHAQEAAQAVDRVAGPLPRFFPHWGSYLELPEDERSHFTLAYRIASDRGVPPEEIRMSYRFGGEEIVFDLDAHGYVGNPPDLAALEAEPEVRINQPEGGMSLAMTFQASLPLGADYEARDLRLVTEQANAAVDRAAGVAAVFAPNYKTLVFVFDGPAPDAWGVDADGERAALTVQENRVLYRPDHRSNRRIERIAFGRAPVRILLDS